MSDSVFDRFSIPTPQKAPQEATAELKSHTDYQAWGIDQAKKQQTRLRIFYGNDTIGLMSYAYLMEAACTSHQLVSLIYTNCVITLEGRNLTELIELLQDERIDYLRCFQVDNYTKPTGDKPIIIDITRKTLDEIRDM